MFPLVENDDEKVKKKIVFEKQLSVKTVSRFIEFRQA